MPHSSRLVIFILALATLLNACAAPSASPPSGSAATAAPATAAPTSAPALPPTTAATAPAVATAAATPTAAAATTGTTELNVFAAASLTESFTVIGKSFEAANPGSKVTFNFAGSNDLAAQINKGAPADVFASANEAQMSVVVKAGQIDPEKPIAFVRNRLVVIYPKDNPAKLMKLQDLANPGVKVVLAAKEVPVGQYALDFMTKANGDPSFGASYKDAVLKNVVSNEQDVKAVLNKVVLGEADAGIVYTTDVTAAAAPKVGRLDIPDALNTIATYPIAVTKGSTHAALAQKFVDFVRAPDGQTVLVKYGFVPTNGSATGAAPASVPLAVSGLVDKPSSLTVDTLRQMPQVSVQATDRGASGPATYTGVALAALLQQVGAQAGAKQVTFTGGDGYSQTVALSDLTADKNAIIAILDDGTLRDIIPSQPPKVWVKGLVKLEVQ